METVEEQPNITSHIDEVKTYQNEEMPTDVVESNVCHKSNGVDCVSSDEMKTEQIAENSILESVSTEVTLEKCNNSDIPESATEEETKNSLEYEKTESTVASNNVNDQSENIKDIEIHENAPSNEEIVTSPIEGQNENITEIQDVGPNNEISNTIKDENEKTHSFKTCIIEEPHVNEEKYQDDEVVLGPTVELCNAGSTTLNDGVHFETEVLVEKNDNDVNENIIDAEYIITETVSPTHNNILSELGDNIELSEVLQSSDVTDSIQNNNATTRVEVFNKEELLDILEGKDVSQSHKDDTTATQENQLFGSDLETEKALKQLSMLKHTRKQRSPRTTKNKAKENFKKIKKGNLIHKVNSFENNADVLKNNDEYVENKPNVAESIQEKDNNIVNALVMDWEDDEQTESIYNDSEKTIVESDGGKAEDNIEINDESTGKSIESLVSEDPLQKQIKSEDEGTPGATRRLGRVIKKKVIFDPDNPDTFTKSKTPCKNKESQPNKEQPPIKKGKIIVPQLEKRKSRSPSAKLQWKKPSPRNSKQHKRLSEVDKLLMDEGAVNMIYQLTPEAPKGRKNVKKKAEFIKKIQSSTPDGKEMKFRERKKETKYEDSEAKKVLVGKHRPSLSSSVKSPSVSEDFETHSADDSIIYRRHSSSSYSSSCMSPRRLSDVEGYSQNSKQQLTSQSKDISNTDPQVDTFLPDENNSIMTEMKTELINKEDCLSLKEKLNSKLSLALNKRKRDSTKLEKPAKQKRVLKSEDKDLINKKDIELQFVSIKIDQHLAEISFKKTGFKNSIEIFNELEQALKFVDDNPEVSVTLLSSQCGILCSSLDLSLLLEENCEIRAKNAYELAESVRSLLATLSQHSKLLCCGVWGACSGVSVALVALCDVALASECTTFAVAASAAPTLPGAAALAAPHRALPQPLVNDLLVFGRRISASEALQGGLISRALWPDRFDEQVQNIVKDIAVQPPQTILLKKRLLGLKKSGEAETTFLSCLESERDLLIEYWTSVEGQELLRTALDAA